MKIYIPGIDGMIGSACQQLLSQTHTVIGSTYETVNLLDYDAVYNFMNGQAIDLIIIAAAKVGGGHAISSQPVEFLQDNIAMQMNIMKVAHQLGIKKLIFIASAAVYPAEAQSPITETAIMGGSLDNVQESYGLAKLVGLHQTRYYNKQYGMKYITVVPTNVIADRDNGQVVYSLFKQMNEAKANNQASITLWGSGNQRREFIFTADVANAIATLVANYEVLTQDVYNIGVQSDLSIKELAYLIKEITNYEGELIFDTTKPEGVYQRLLDSSALFELGFKPQKELIAGLKKIQAQF
ncbi:MAG: NAD-dependent epimerase/dehydratase family protein [Culicoidibacterales bacterium]